MYTGTLISELMAVVERTEAHVRGNRTGTANWSAGTQLSIERNAVKAESSRGGLDGSGSVSTRIGGIGPAALVLDRHARDLFLEGHRQLAPGEGGRSAPRPRDAPVRYRTLCLFLLVMTYAWQHFKAIEYGYQIESLKIQRDGMVEMNRDSASGRCVPAQSRADRCDGAQTGIAISAGRTSDAPGWIG